VNHFTTGTAGVKEEFMKKKTLFAAILMLIVTFNCLAVQSPEKKTITVGVVLDGFRSQSNKPLSLLRKELKSLLGSKYNIQVPEEKIMDLGWSIEAVNNNYEKLVKDPKVDIILGVGSLTSSLLYRKKEFPKPLILIGIIEPEFLGITRPTHNVSGVHNLTYILFNRSVTRDLDEFYKVYPYKKVGIVFYGEILKLFPVPSQHFKGIMDKNKTQFKSISITNSIDDVLNNLDGVDAVYLGYLLKLEDVEKTKLLTELNNRKIPTFGSSMSDVKHGALASLAGEENFPKIVRRISLDIESILNGEDPSTLPIHISFEENLTINIKTAKEIDYSPKISLLMEAEFINQFAVKSSRVISLQDAVKDGLKANLDIIIQELKVKAAKKDVSMVRSNLFPSLTLSGTGAIIDKKRASPLQPERTLSGSAALEQLLFSEEVLGGIAINKHLLRASRFSYRQIKLNITLDTAISYINILMAKNLRKIRKANIDLTKRNLDISKQREAVGYSGRSDIYRWESSLTSASTDLISAQNSVTLAKMQLNMLLNRPLDEEYIVKDAELTNFVFLGLKAPGPSGLSKLIDNVDSIKIFTEFLVDTAIDNSFEIAQINANIAALKRSLQSLKRKRLLPTLGLGAKIDNVFSRGGEGTNQPGASYIDTTWNLGVTLSLPIFKGGLMAIDIGKTQIEIDQLKGQRTQLAQALELNIRSAVLDLVLNFITLKSSRKAAELSQKSLELVQDSYSKGRVSIVDLADSQNSALNAELSALNSVYEFLISVLKTQKAIGNFHLFSTLGEQQTFFNSFKTYMETHSR
jgi:outer membrane protein